MVSENWKEYVIKLIEEGEVLVEPEKDKGDAKTKIIAKEMSFERESIGAKNVFTS